MSQVMNIPHKKEKVLSSIRNNGLLDPKQPNSVEDTHCSDNKKPFRIIKDACIQINQTDHRSYVSLVGRQEQGETRYLLSRSCRGRDIVLLESR